MLTCPVVPFVLGGLPLETQQTKQECPLFSPMATGHLSMTGPIWREEQAVTTSHKLRVVSERSFCAAARSAHSITECLERKIPGVGRFFLPTPWVGVCFLFVFRVCFLDTLLGAWFKSSQYPLGVSSFWGTLFAGVVERETKGKPLSLGIPYFETNRYGVK